MLAMFEVSPLKQEVKRLTEHNEKLMKIAMANKAKCYIYRKALQYYRYSQAGAVAVEALHQAERIK